MELHFDCKTWFWVLLYILCKSVPTFNFSHMVECGCTHLCPRNSVVNPFAHGEIAGKNQKPPPSHSLAFRARNQCLICLAPPRKEQGKAEAYMLPSWVHLSPAVEVQQLYPLKRRHSTQNAVVSSRPPATSTTVVQCSSSPWAEGRMVSKVAWSFIAISTITLNLKRLQRSGALPRHC